MASPELLLVPPPQAALTQCWNLGDIVWGSWPQGAVGGKGVTQIRSASNCRSMTAEAGGSSGEGATLSAHGRLGTWERRSVKGVGLIWGEEWREPSSAQEARARPHSQPTHQIHGEGRRQCRLRGLCSAMLDSPQRSGGASSTVARTGADPSTISLALSRPGCGVQLKDPRQAR